MAEPFALPSSDTWMEGDLHVALALPQTFGAAPAGPVPLLLLLDGQSLFLTATEFCRTTSLVTLGALPPIAVAAVWRAAADPLEYFSTRFRDFTPYEWVLPEPFAEDNAMARFGTGGGGAFLDELVSRVLPAVRARVDVGEVGIGGWSLSGLFAAWAWRERPDVFAHTIAISPSLWWAHARMLDEPLPSRDGARAFISAGQREEGDMARVWPRVFADAEQRHFAGMLRNAVEFGRMCEAAGIATQTVVFEDEHHVTLGPASLSRGIRHLWATP